MKEVIYKKTGSGNYFISEKPPVRESIPRPVENYSFSKELMRTIIILCKPSSISKVMKFCIFKLKSNTLIKEHLIYPISKSYGAVRKGLNQVNNFC